MLKMMRDQFKNLKIVLWFVVFVFVLLIFVDWGTGRAGRRGQASGSLLGVAAKVGSIVITEPQFLKEMRSTEERFRQMYGKQYESMRSQLDLASMTLQNLVDRQLLLLQAHKMGLEVSDREVLDKIMSFPVFKKDDGSFVGGDLYARILRSNQTSPDEFEAALRQEILLDKLQQAVGAGIIIPASDVAREYRRRNESASFDVLFVPADRALGRVTVTEADGRAYYDSYKETFAHPDQRQLRYLLVDDGKLRRTMTVPEKQIADYYTTHTSEFASGEEVHARHILIRPASQDDAGWHAAQEKVREIEANLHAPNADFAALAKQYSDDPGSKDNGGDLGWFGHGRMVKEFEDAVFALRPGEVSGPVKSSYGYHIIKLEDRRPASTRPLTEVRDMIQSKLAEGLADAEGNRRATALREKIDAAKLTTDEQWQKLGDDVVSSNVTPFFAQGELIPGLGRDPELLAEVWAAKEGFVGGPRRTSRGWIVYRLAQIRKAGTPPFEEVKDAAMEGAKRAKAEGLLRTDLEAKRAELTASLSDQAGALGGVVQTAKDHKRGSAIPGIGTSITLEDAVFATPVGALTPVVTVGERGVAIAKVTAKTAFDPAAFAKEKDALHTSMTQEEVQRMLSAMLAEAKRENPVTINNELIDRFKPRKG